MANRRRFLAILLSLLMLLQALPMSALAEGWKVARSNIEEGATYYTVTFEVEDTAVATQLIESGETVSTFPEDPFKADYQFDGWFVGDAEFTDSTSVSANTTVEAKFTPIDAYEVTIKYVDETGAEVADSIVRSYLVTDAQDVIESPASVVVGEGEEQKTLYPDLASVTINPAELPAEDEDADKKVVYTVTYAESNATYTVKHLLKDLEGEGYTEIEDTAQTLNGVVGSSPVPDPLSTETYPYIEYEKYDPATVAEDGSTVINVYYTRKNVTLTYDSRGGSYIAPKFAPYGSTVNVYSIVPGGLGCGLEEHTHSEKPSGNGDYDGQTSGCYTWNKGWFWGSWTLTCGKSPHTHNDSCYAEDAYNPAPTPAPAYTFAGWYTDPDCTTPASAQTELNGNQTVYAKWKAGKADYTIVYLEQVYDNAIGDTRYVYYTSQVGTGTVGDMAHPRQLNSGIKYKEYRDGDGAVIKADSSTVVYAYYDLIEYTFVFDLDDRNATLTIGGEEYKNSEYRFTAVYGQDVSKMWPTTDMVSGEDLYGWVPNHDRTTTYVTLRFEVTDDMLPSSGTTASYTASYSSGTRRIARYWLQTTDGSGYEVSDRYSQVLISSSNLSGKELSGFTLRNNKPSGDQYPQQYQEEVNIEFKGTYYRNTDVHNFYYDREQYGITYRYGTQGLKDFQNVYFGADISGDTYDWQPTPESVDLPADYTFAGWYDNAECLGDPYTFTTMPANNLALYAKFTPPQRTVTLVYYDGVKDGSIVVTYGETVGSLQTPTRPGYTFLGWFTDQTATEPFDINRPITEDMTIYAGWQRKALEYKVQYLEEGTNESLLPAQTIRNAAYTEGQTVTASAPTISGYRVDAMTKSINLNIDPSKNVITFYYALRQKQEYSVHYYVQGTETKVADSKTATASAEVERVVEMAVDPEYEDYKDYYPIEKVKTAPVTTSLKEIIFYYAPYGTVTYTINHVDKGGNAIPGAESQTIPKKIGDSIQPEIYKETITGYTFDHVEDGKEYLVAKASGTVVVNLYYARTFTVTYDKGDHGSLAGDDDNDGQIIHANIVEGSATPAAPTVTAEEGYYFTGWSPAREETVTATVTYTAQYAEKHEITVVANSGTEKYDGTEKSVSGLVSTTFEVEGNTYTVEGLSASASGKDAGEYPAEVTGTAVVKDADGNDVTKQFSVTRQDGKLTIEKREVTLTSGSATKEYDGKPLTNDEVTVGGDGFAEGEGATYTVTGSQTIVGSSDNEFTYELNDGTKEANYTITQVKGTLTVTDREEAYEITVVANSGTEKYDGTEKSVSGLVSTTFEVEGNTYTVEGLSASASGKDAGEYPAEVTGTAVVKDADGNDVTKQFSVTRQDGKLTIEKREVTLTSGSATKEYDGKPLTNDEVTVGGDGFAEGEGATYTVTGSQTIVGSSDNEFTYELNDGTKEANYTISQVKGTLTVTDREEAYEITVVANSGTEKYDGTEKSVSGLVSTTFEVEGNTYTVEGLSASASGKDAGEYPAEVTGTAVVKDADGNDVTKQFSVTRQDGKLTIEKREVTLTSGSATKEYDGKPLTNDEVTVGGDGFAEGEGATYTVTGSQTIVGSSDNEFTYELNDGTKEANYTITQVKGKLTVTDRSEKYAITLTGNSGEVRYDGTEHTVSGFETMTFEFNGVTYTVSGVSTSVSGTNAGDYSDDPVDTTAAKVTTEIDGESVDVTDQFTVTATPATLKINPITDEVTVTIVGNNDSKFYTGQPHTVEGYTFSIDNDLYTENDFALAEDVEAKATRTEVGTTYMELTKDSFVNKSDNFTNVKFEVTDGYIEVKPAEGMIVVTIVGKNDTVTYDGEEHTVTGYEVTDIVDASDLYRPEYVGLADGAAASAARTDVGTTKMGLTETSFENTNPNFGNVVFNVTDGYITVEAREATLTSQSASKVYDGTPLTKVGVEAEGFVDGEGVDWLMTGSQTLVGESKNTFEYEAKDGTKLTNYIITTVLGTLTVTDEGVDPDDVVSKTHDGAVEYDLGDVVTFTISVKNIYAEAKTITLSEIEGVTLAQSVFENVPAGETITTTATYTITEADILEGSFVNTVTAAFTDGETFENTDEVTPEEPNGHLTINKVTTSTPENGTGYALGETITYEITVENDGNLTITDITVTDDLTGDTWTIPSLEPGAEETFTAEYVVTEADILAGSVKNVATATGTSPDPDEPDPGVDPGEEEDETEDKNGHLTINKVTTSTPENGTGYALGETITYEITVVNDGNLTITDITVTDDLTGDTWTIPSLEPGAEETFTAEYVVTEADILAGSVKNVATATGTNPDPDEPDPGVDPGEEEDETEDKNGHLTINKVTTSTPENGTGYALGETITYEITVENDGNLTITDITVTDDLTGDEWTILSLEPGAEETFTAEYVVTEADILAGSVKNVATATGTSPDPDEPDPGVDPGEEEDETEDKNGHLTINKVTTSTPENGTGYALGETITYEITVVNDGNLTITDITVTDDLTGDEWTILSLEPGAEETFTAEYVVTEADILAGSVKNVATATGTSPDPDEPDPGEDPGEEEDETEDKNGHLTINKVTTSTPENGTGYALGETITYEITVVNDGNLTITDITVTDDLTGDTWTIPSLEPGAEETFTAEYVVTEADILAGSVKNVATATGTNPDPDEPDPGVDPGEEEDETEDKNGHLTINKVTTSTPENGESYALGETITYEITVVNDGNLTITDITVTDDLTGDEWTIPSLEPGAEETFTAEYVVTETDILAGSVKNVATATGTSPDDPDDPDDPDEPEVDPGEEDTPTEDKNGHLTIEKETTGVDANNDGVYEEGETIRYLIRVINDGNLTITDITVTDELTGDTWTIESLEPGAEQTFTTSHVVSSADGAAGVVVNVATATGTSPDPEQPDVPVTPGTEEVPTEEEAIRTDLTARINYVYIGNSALNRTERLYDLTQGEVITDIGSRVLRNTIDGYTVSRVEGLPMTVRVTESRNVITVYYEPQILTEILDLEVPTGASLGGLNVGDCCE